MNPYNLPIKGISFLYDKEIHMDLSIAGYIIRIHFLPTEWIEKKILLIRMIEKYFGGFKIHNSKNIDATIIFKEISGIPFTSKLKKIYSLYFERKNKNIYETYYHISIFELSQLLLIIVIKLLAHKGFLLHASGVETKKGVNLFMGPSGAGKSTTMKMVGSSFIPFSDDCVIIKKTGKTYVCYQAPWIEKDSELITVSSKHTLITSLYTIRKNKTFKGVVQTKMELVKEIVKNIWTVEGVPGKTMLIVSDFVRTGIKGIRLSLDLNDGEKLRDLLR